MTFEKAEDDDVHAAEEKESGLATAVHVDEGFATATKKARKGKVEAGNLKPKKPLSKWIRFSCEQREVMMKENPQLGLMEVNKLISEKYKQISAADSERLDALAAQDKERYQRELSEWQDPIPTAADGDRPPTAELTFPLSRVRKTIKLDPDVRKVSSECAVVITKATELFAMHLAAQSARTASLRGSRAVRDVDVLHTIHSSDALAFLRMDFPKKAITTSSGATSATVGSGSQAAAAKAKAAPSLASASGDNIRKYFAVSKHGDKDAFGEEELALEGPETVEEDS